MADAEPSLEEQVTKSFGKSLWEKAEEITGYRQLSAPHIAGGCLGYLLNHTLPFANLGLFAHLVSNNGSNVLAIYSAASVSAFALAVGTSTLLSKKRKQMIDANPEFWKSHYPTINVETGKVDVIYTMDQEVKTINSDLPGIQPPKIFKRLLDSTVYSAFETETQKKSMKKVGKDVLRGTNCVYNLAKYLALPIIPTIRTITNLFINRYHTGLSETIDCYMDLNEKVKTMYQEKSNDLRRNFDIHKWIKGYTPAQKAAIPLPV